MVMRRCMNTGMKGILIAVFVLVPALLMAASAEQPNYTIRKGDTLWTIAESKFKNPLLWQRIWKANPYIRNPHWIYPGNTLVLPDGMGSADAGFGRGDGSILKITPKPIETQPVGIQKAYPLLSRQDTLMTGYITPDPAVVVGSIIGASKDKTILGVHDHFYFTTERQAPEGTKFFILAKPEEIKHPVSNASLGKLHRVIGVAQVVKPDNDSLRAVVLEAFQEIKTDDVLGRFAPVEPPVFLGPARTPAIDGVIVRIMPMAVLGGNADVVYLDKGTVDGLRFGDELKFFSANPPYAFKGTIQVVGVMENTASAVVRKSNSEVLVGDTVKN